MFAESWHSTLKLRGATLLEPVFSSYFFMVSLGIAATVIIHSTVNGTERLPM